LLSGLLRCWSRCWSRLRKILREQTPNYSSLSFLSFSRLRRRNRLYRFNRFWLRRRLRRYLWFKFILKRLKLYFFFYIKRCVWRNHFFHGLRSQLFQVDSL
tara:strand:- start:12 stop:314 length:303 start_codon:yes stop_codon:yes gene_type:complete